MFTPRPEDRFMRVAVELERPAGGGWIATGLTNGQPVVVTGAQVLLSTELKAGGGEE